MCSIAPTLCIGFADESAKIRDRLIVLIWKNLSLLRRQLYTMLLENRPTSCLLHILKYCDDYIYQLFFFMRVVNYNVFNILIVR